MNGPSHPWRPTTVRRFIRAFPTSTRVVLVDTDAGQGYLKAMGGPEGPHPLACEWVGTQLARWLGLLTFDFSLIEVTADDELPFAGGGHAMSGPAFIARAESGEPWSGDPKQLMRLSNPEHLARLVVFDTWTLNCDRHCAPPKGKVGWPRINRDNVFLSEDEAPAGQLILKAMDHTCCFTCGRELTTAVRMIDNIKEGRVFGLFPEFRRFIERGQIRRAANDLARIDPGTLHTMIHTIPKEWEVTREVQDALGELILTRAAYVADTIERKIWPQRALEFGNSPETELPP